jgi:general secretion pathway protein D
MALTISAGVHAQPPVLLPPDATKEDAVTDRSLAVPPASAPSDRASPLALPIIPLPPAEVPPLPQQPAAPPIKAPPKESDDLATALERRGDLNLHGLTLNAALFTISEQWNINIVAGEVQGTVNGVFKQAPLREILDAILLSNGYNYRAVGKSLVVSSVQALGQVNPFFQSATIRVRTADIDEVVEGAKLLVTPQGQVRALKSARSIVVLDFPDRVEMIRKFVAAVEGASGGQFSVEDGGDGLAMEVGYFRTQHITAKTAADALQAVLSKEGKVAIMEKEDRLLVTDHAANLVMIEKVIARVDRPRPQVRITALIYDISLQDIEELGLDWNRLQFNSSDNSGISIATSSAPFGSAIDSLTPAAGNIAIGTLSTHFDIDGVCRALQQAKDARLLADPNVAVLENEEAVFKSTREIPIQQLTETQQGGNIGTTAFKEAGITLTVTPKIAIDGTICMIVAPEFSRHVGFDPAGQPIFDKREAKTTLCVVNRQTAVIGGLRQREDIGDFSGIPYLKDLKLVGRLFRSRSTNIRESELVVFITPEIIDYADQPKARQEMVADTVRCRLDQIPEAEGCPPCCRRLPPEATPVDVAPGAEMDPDTLPPAVTPSAAEPAPEPADNAAPEGIKQPDFAKTRVRRLPSVEPASAQVANHKEASGRLLFADPAGLQPEMRTADRDTDIWR